uniref:EPS8 signaling adaptor L3b n=2 Tax=Erpetoichthys calabaricus TaxID=27687 RepID=A0A8C4RSL9_ERPCA
MDCFYLFALFSGEREGEGAQQKVPFSSVQRKEYAEEVNKQVRNVEYRVEHLFSCELDQKDLKTVDDCISRLKLLDARGRVWGQEMILQVKNGSLQLMDIEAKEELESFSLSSILDCQAVINSCVYSSILSVTVQEKSKRRRSVLLFQCDEFGVSSCENLGSLFFQLLFPSLGVISFVSCRLRPSPKKRLISFSATSIPF